MKEVCVLGVGMHPWGKFDDKSVKQMVLETGNRAIEDASVKWRDIGFVGAASPLFEGGMDYGLAANELLLAINASGVPVYNVSAGCAAGGVAFNAAYRAVADGMCDIALAMGGEKMPKGFIPYRGTAQDITNVEYLRWVAVGIPNPGYWAFEARRRMEDFGTTATQFAKVSVKAHKIGAQNPYARYRKVFTVEEVLNSNMIDDPLHLYEICAVSDGAAMVVLGTAEEARKRTTKPVFVAGSAALTGAFGDTQVRVPDLSATAKATAPHFSEVVNPVRKCYESAGIGPREIDFVELSDNTVWHELAWPEYFGMLEPGESDWMVDHDETTVDGKLPINPSGGFLSFGEATTAMGLFQVCELVWQLRGQAGTRQVKNPKVGLAVSLGLGANGSAAILRV